MRKIGATIYSYNIMGERVKRQVVEEVEISGPEPYAQYSQAFRVSTRKYRKRTWWYSWIDNDFPPYNVILEGRDHIDIPRASEPWPSCSGEPHDDWFRRVAMPAFDAVFDPYLESGVPVLFDCRASKLETRPGKYGDEWIFDGLNSAPVKERLFA